MSPRIEEFLSKIASQIMALDEETLTSLLPKYKEKMLNFAPTQAWEESVLVYFIINGLRIKNSQFNEKIKEYMVRDDNDQTQNPYIRPRLRLVPKKKPGHTQMKPEDQEEMEHDEN